MAYLVLARKYRPERFADMIGQEHVTRTLQNAITHDRVHHAYLLTGVRGLGKTTAARILAKALVCERGPAAEPCNECGQCTAVNQGRSVDVIEIDGASNNSVDDIRTLREQVNYLPQLARRKIYLIDEVHMLTTSAFNALLKTLEEPPAHVTFIFATTDPQKVLPTILSRVSRLDLRRVAPAVLIEHLRKVLTAQGWSLDEDGLRLVAVAGEGSVRDSLTLLDKVIAFADDPCAVTADEVRATLGLADRWAVHELVESALAGNPGETLRRFDTLCATASDMSRIAISILQHLRDLAVLKSAPDGAALVEISETLLAALLEQAKGVSVPAIARYFDQFARATATLDASRAPRLVLEMAVLELASPEPLEAISSLAARLDRVVRTVGAQAGSPPSSSSLSSAGSGSSSSGTAPKSATKASEKETPRASQRGEAAAREAFKRDETKLSAPAFEAADALRTAQASAAAPPIAAAHARREASMSAQDEGSQESADAPDSFDPTEMLRQYGASIAQTGAVNGLSRSTARRNGPRQESQQTVVPTPSAPSSTPLTVPSLAAPDPREGSSSQEATLNDGAAWQSSTAPGGSTEELALVVQDPLAWTSSTTRMDATPREAGAPTSLAAPATTIPWRELSAWQAWEQLLLSLQDEDEMLYGVMCELGLQATDASGFVICAASGSAIRTMFQGPELSARLDAYVRAHLGESVRFRVVDGEPELTGAPSLNLVQADRARAHRETVEEEVRRDARVRAVIELLGATLEGIDVEPPSAYHLRVAAQVPPVREGARRSPFLGPRSPAP